MFIRITFCLALSVFSASACLAGQLEDKVAELAKRVLAFSEGESVKVGVFSPTGLPDSSFGIGLSQSLKEAIEREKRGGVDDDADFEIKGDYLYVKSRNHPDLAKVVKVDLRIINLEFGEEVSRVPFKIELDHTNAIAEATQQTVALPADGTKIERNRILAESVKRPEFHLAGPRKTQVSSGPKSPFAVEVLVRRSLSDRPMPRSVKNVKGRPFVDIERDELYELRLYNHTQKEIAAKISIDGIGMYHFSKDRKSDGTPAFSHVMIGPRSSATVVGWHVAVQGDVNYQSFLVTSYGKGAASKAGIKAPGELGVIHVQFANANVIPMGARSSPGKVTGFGPPRKVFQKPVQRAIDPPHDFVSIRYAR